MADKKIHKGIRFPKTVLAWLAKKTKKSGRTFSGEVIHILTCLMEGRMK